MSSEVVSVSAHKAQCFRPDGGCSWTGPLRGHLKDAWADAIHHDEENHPNERTPR